MADQKIALITGAGGGVGRACALAMAEAGYDLLLTTRTKDKLEATVEAVATEFPETVVHPFAADLTDPAAGQAIVEAGLERFGQIDAAFNVAGDAPLLPIGEVTPKIWRQCIDLNLSCVVMLTAALWPVFRKQKSGFVGNVSSMASIDPFPGFGIYAAAKTGLNMFTRCTAKEGAKMGVKAVSVAPGAIETPMLRSIFAEDMIPKDKTLDPFEVAEVLRDCATGAREFKNGQTIELPSP